MEDERYPHIVSTDKKQKNKTKRPTQQQTQKAAETQPMGAKQKDPGRWRDLTAFFFLGICNNFGFNVILTAAHDIISVLGKDNTSEKTFIRECNHMSTGAILLADVIPALLIKVAIPFVAGYTHAKIACTIVITIISFIMLSVAQSQTFAIFAVITTSFAYGLGEATLLGHTTRYHKLVVSTWSSGTGASALLSSLCYSALRQISIPASSIILYMISVPCLEVFVFWVLLRHHSNDTESLNTPNKIGIVNEVFTILPEPELGGDDKSNNNSTTEKISEPVVQWVGSSSSCEKLKDVESNSVDDSVKFSSIGDKLRYLPHLIRVYMAPLLFIYFSQYFINQGLLELIYFNDVSIKRAAQYRWFQVTYQISVFISRSSVNFFHFHYIWLLAALQVFNMIYFSLEAVYFFTPNIYIILGLIFWEGLVGGSAYVNTFYRIREEVPEEKKSFAMSITTFADSPGITLAGLAAIPAHDFICNLPLPARISTLLDIVGSRM